MCLFAFFKPLKTLTAHGSPQLTRPINSIAYTNKNALRCLTEGTAYGA